MFYVNKKICIFEKNNNAQYMIVTPLSKRINLMAFLFSYNKQ